MTHSIAEEDIEKLKALRPGVALCFGNAFNIPVFVKIDKPDPTPDSNNAHIGTEWFKEPVVIVNPMFDGLFDVKAFKAEMKLDDTRFIALSTAMLDQNVLSGYDEHFLLYDNPDDIFEKIKKVLMSEKQDEPNTTESLSNREREIIVCVVKGMTNKEIADQLCLSIHTVITHRRNISNKLQIRSAAGLTIYAIVNKLVDIKDVKDM